MVRPAISTPYPLPREREAGADDKSPKINFSRIDWSKERTPVAIIHNDVAPLALREFQLNDALLSQREFQIDEGGALAHPAKPETATMNKQPLSSFQRVLDELDAIGADTRPDLAALTKAIRAFGNAQYDPLWMGMDVSKGPDGASIVITTSDPAVWEALESFKASTPSAAQQDNAAVEIFAAEMQQKLARSRGKGRGGWQSISADILSRELREHVDKGDPMDVATYAMFLWHNGQPISAQQQNGRDKADLTKDQHNAYNAVITFVTEDGYVDGLDFLRLWNEGDFAACRRDWPEAPEACYTGLETPYGSEREVR